MRKALAKVCWVLSVLLMVQLSAHASIAAVPELPQLKLVGAGQLSWWGMTVYDASLYAPDGAYRPDRPHAIKITYQFNFSQDQLARKSLEEIERMFGAAPDREAVFKRLKSVFRDVTKGDHIVGVHYPGRGADFYSEKVLLGRIEAADLAKAFFSIWLNPKTSEPDLRAQLLGYTP